MHSYLVAGAFKMKMQTGLVGNQKKEPYLSVNSFLASSLLLFTFANSLDPDQDRQNVGPDLDPNCLTL